MISFYYINVWENKQQLIFLILKNSFENLQFSENVKYQPQILFKSSLNSN